MSVTGQATRRSSRWSRVAQMSTTALILVLFVADETQMLRSARPVPGPAFILVFCAVAISVWLAAIVLHEVGHLVAALVMVLPVQSVRLLPGRRRSGKPAQVRVAPNPAAAALPIRMAVMALGGPGGNLGIAALFRQLADRPGIGAEQHGLLLLPVITGLGIGAGNLIPLRSRGHRSDGMQAFAWLTRPTRNREALVMKRSAAAAGRLAAYGAEVQRGGVPDLAGLREIADETGEGNEANARAAAVLLMAASMRAGTAEFTADIPRFVRAVRDPGLRPETAAAMGGRVAWVQGLDLLRQFVGRRESAPEKAAEIAALAEYAYAKDRSNSVARCALGLIRLAQNRAGEARDLLVGADADAGTEKERADILAVRALVEFSLGDYAQSRRLIAAVRRLGTTPAIQLPLIEILLENGEKRRAAEATAAPDMVADP